MYAEFLKALLAYVQAINEACKGLDESDHLTPYLDHLPVILEGELCGFLVDEIGGAYAYRDATESDRAWWTARPWGRGL